jgi:hypothetical protein
MADLSMLADPSHGKVTAHSESGHIDMQLGDANARRRENEMQQTRDEEMSGLIN